MSTPADMPAAAVTIPTVVVPAPDSALDAACAELASIQPEADRLAARVDELRSLIKEELGRRVPEGSTEVLLDSPYLDGMRRLVAKSKMVFDSRRFKAEDLETYCRYAKKQTSWYFERAK
jgi:hypothetical protein